MYCPNCASSIDGVKFCRSCGSNVSLVPQAMSGKLPQAKASEGEYINDYGLHFGVHHSDGHHRRKKDLNVEHAMTEIFIGISFLIAAISVLIFAPAGVFWWWALLIPAFALFGEGVGKYLRLREQQRKQASPNFSVNQPVAYQSSELPPTISAPTTSELVKPSSVTEHTTRHLE
jgi:hypothetical protein